MSNKTSQDEINDNFDVGYHLHEKEKHKENVTKNSDRIKYAIEQFEKYGIEYSLKNKETGHFHCRRKCDDKLFQFYAGTGKIIGRDVRGIHNLIIILTDDRKCEE